MSSCTYSFAKKDKFACIEQIFRAIQSVLLLYMIFCFLFYMITFGVDIAKLSSNLTYLFISLAIDLKALLFIGLGIRGVALEIWLYVILLDIAVFLVALSHIVTFLFRHPGLNSANLLFDTLLLLLAVLYTIYLCKFESNKPEGYGVVLPENGILTDGEMMSGEATSGGVSGTDSMFLMSPTESKLTEITGMELSEVQVETEEAKA